MRRIVFIGLAVLSTTGPVVVQAQTTRVDADQLVYRSSGQAQGSGWTLDQNGYLGTYIRLDQPGSVTLSIDADQVPAATDAPHASIAVDDAIAGFDVTGLGGTYEHTFDLSAGTHLVRTQLDNAQPGGDGTGPALTVRSLGVDGATLVNDGSDATALSAANTYIDHGRKGAAHVALPGARAGDRVQVRLTNHAFNFGTAVSGTNVNGPNNYLTDNPAPGSDAAQYQDFVNNHFNTLVPENAGKWGSNEPFPGFQTLGQLDNILDYAQDHDMRARLHNVAWATDQQPYFANNLLQRAQNGDDGAKQQLRQAISDRIQYYVADRADQFVEVDGVNEALHQPAYLEVFGEEGLADIYNEIADAVAGHPGNRGGYVNEYNVVQNSSNPITGGASDPYANWYRQHVENIQAAGGEVGGIGVQDYAGISFFEDPPGPAQLTRVFQNLAVTGLPLSLTEFGIKEGFGVSEQDAADFLEQTIRTVFGTPGATTFVNWGFWEDDIYVQAVMAALVDSDWNLTPAGERYEQLMDQWDTDLDLTVNDDGTLDFTGFYGTYDLLIDGQTYQLDLTKGTTNYLVAVPEPATLGLFAAAGLAGLTRPRRRRTN